MDLPLGLTGALEAGQCVLFIGAGIGHYLRTPDGGKAPDAAILAEGLADRYKIDFDGVPDLAKGR